MLTIKYEWKDFFGNLEFRTDSVHNPTEEQKKKAFSFFKKDYSRGIDVDEYTFYHGCISDFENDIVTVRHFLGHGLSWDKEEKMSADKAKKFFYSLFEREQ